MKILIKSQIVLFVLFVCITGLTFGSTGRKGNENREKIFVIHAPVKNLDDYREVAKQAARLKPYGRVEVNISTLAEKGFHEIPEGRNFWYEYASYNPTPFKFFPDPKIAPFIPADFVKKNRELLQAKAKILRSYNLEAAFWCYEPNFLPEEFFVKYPHMMGPRVDHPRRGNYPAFAPCISVKETQEMFTNMVAELLRNVPEIHTFFFKTNDAGSGICWSDWQYTGPNGPDHCKDLSMGERMETLMNTFKKGADKAGEDISIYLTGSMFSDEEKEDIYEHLPEDCFFQNHNSDEVKGINSMIVGNYPVKGLFNPLEIIRNIESIKKETTNTVFVSFRASYDRDYENPEAMEKFMDLLIENLESTQEKEVMDEEKQLYKIFEKWAGNEGAGQLDEAFKTLNEAGKFRSDSVQGASAMYWGVTERHITRPLVFAPQLLSPAEESYFMPYVFNPSEEEARMDYTDIHGAHRTLTSGAANKYVAKVNRAIRLFENVSDNAPEKEFIQNMVKALKIHSSIFRSIGNFAEAQAIRDRNAETLAMAPHRPNKIPTWDGDSDFLPFITVMRDEMDNTQELIDVLEDGGMDFIAHADDPKYEDTFLLGPDLIEQLKLKREIMLKHWTDIEGYLASPFK
jgi:hypothetical protein